MGPKNCLKQENSVQTTTGDERYSPGYANAGDLEMVSKTVVVIEREKRICQHNIMDHRKGALRLYMLII